ncbi:hypothetical protein KJ682_07510 [bacterium]|nr:hypothetical protein [bacterium]
MKAFAAMSMTGLVLGMTLGAAPVAADVLEIPLDAILGAYPDGQVVERIASFDLGFSPEAVSGAWIQFTGVIEEAFVECDGGADAWPMEFYAMMPDGASGNRWLAFEPSRPTAGIIAFALPFATDPDHEATWDFLADGTGVLHFYAGPVGLTGTCLPTGGPPVAVVDEAVLVLDLKTAVPVEARSFGAVKALFQGGR